MSHIGILRAWRTARISALGELLSPGRITAGLVRMAAQLFLVVCLWRALYADAGMRAGLTKDQAVTYAVLAVLAMRVRLVDRRPGRDTVFQQMKFGTIVYWFLRPVSARRYYLLRSAGDQLYGMVWACAGYAICRAAGALSGPASIGSGLAFAASFLLGQCIMYYLMLLTDQICFWSIQNTSASDIVMFAQNLLSGAYAALWYFPGWFRAASSVLPFQSTMNVPLSFYIGRLPVSALPGQLAAEGAWIIALAGFTRLVWQRASIRVASQGG
jgi:ABC-2 type transport system permease protein